MKRAYFCWSVLILFTVIFAQAQTRSLPTFEVDGMTLDTNVMFPANISRALNQWRTGFPVTAVNDNPALAGIEGTALAYTENDPATAITSTLTVSDVDSTNLSSATVQISTNYQNGQDVLAFTDQNGITGSWNAATCRPKFRLSAPAWHRIRRLANSSDLLNSWNR